MARASATRKPAKQMQATYTQRKILNMLKRGRPSVRSIQIRYFVIVRLESASLFSQGIGRDRNVDMKVAHVGTKCKT